MNEKHNFISFANEALNQAEIACKYGEVPVGAVIVDGKNNQIIAVGHNQNIELKDPTAHAEIVAIRKACQKVGSHILEDCDIYVTLEPCHMCATAISNARIRRLYYLLADEKYGAVENGAKIFSTPKLNHYKTEIYPSASQEQADKSKKLLQKFFQQRRCHSC